MWNRTEPYIDGDGAFSESIIYKRQTERFSDLAVLEFGGFRTWLFLSLAVAKIDLFSGFVFLLLNISHGSGF